MKDKGITFEAAMRFADYYCNGVTNAERGDPEDHWVEFLKDHEGQIEPYEPYPVSTPSELTVEVDGEVKGYFPMFDQGRKNADPNNPKETWVWWERYKEFGHDVRCLSDHHIRLLKPNGEVVMDNKFNEEKDKDQ